MTGRLEEALPGEPAGPATAELQVPPGCADHEWTPWYGGPLVEYRWCQRCDQHESR